MPINAAAGRAILVDDCGALLARAQALQVQHTSQPARRCPAKEKQAVWTLFCRLLQSTHTHTAHMTCSNSAHDRQSGHMNFYQVLSGPRVPPTMYLLREDHFATDLGRSSSSNDPLFLPPCLRAPRLRDSDHDTTTPRLCRNSYVDADLVCGEDVSRATAEASEVWRAVEGAWSRAGINENQRWNSANRTLQ